MVNWKKKTYNLKVENYILFDRFAEDLNLEGSLSDRSEGLFQGVSEELEFCKKKKKNSRLCKHTHTHTHTEAIEH